MSKIIDQWGNVVSQAPDGVGIITADIETDCVAAIRSDPLVNRRPEPFRLR